MSFCFSYTSRQNRGGSASRGTCQVLALHEGMVKACSAVRYEPGIELDLGSFCTFLKESALPRPQIGEIDELAQCLERRRLLRYIRFPRWTASPDQRPCNLHGRTLLQPSLAQGENLFLTHSVPKATNLNEQTWGGRWNSISHNEKTFRFRDFCRHSEPYHPVYYLRFFHNRSSEGILTCDALNPPLASQSQ